MDSSASNSGPYDCMASPLPSESSISPDIFNGSCDLYLPTVAGISQCSMEEQKLGCP